MRTGSSSSKRSLGTSSSKSSRRRDDAASAEAYYRKNKKKKKGEKEDMAASPVQNLYEICREIFSNGSGHQAAGYIPPPYDIAELKSFLDGMRPEDVNLAPDMAFFRGTNYNDEEEATQDRVITYLHIHQCNKFSIGIFCLPQSAVIPLHDHPNMTVFSKLLFGSLRVKSYDWVDNNNNNDYTTTAVITGDTENSDQTVRNQTSSNEESDWLKFMLIQNSVLHVKPLYFFRLPVETCTALEP